MAMTPEKIRDVLINMHRFAETSSEKNRAMYALGPIEAEALENAIQVYERIIANQPPPRPEKMAGYKSTGSGA